ncbi:MAG: helix-turn-helix domain-containing protein [Pseudomonadota bacterium]
MTRNIDGDLIRRLRTEASLSQEDLAGLAGISARTLQRLEAESSGSASSLRAVAAALDVNIHNISTRPAGHQVGIRLGFAGIIVGVLGALVGIAAGIGSDSLSAGEAGAYIGIVSTFAGLSCALLGWASNAYPSR